MKTVEKNILVAHSAQQMFELVDKVEDYPEFLPWYGKTEVISREGDELKARLYMDYKGVKQSFATHNRNVPGREIRMELLEGPFKTLRGRGISSIWAATAAKSNSASNMILPTPCFPP